MRNKLARNGSWSFAKEINIEDNRVRSTSMYQECSVLETS